MSGGSNFFSEVTQLATGSRFGHVAVVLGDGLLVQATDVSLTPPEDDEGVFPLSYEDFHRKTAELSDIRAIRPGSVDIGRLRQAADYLMEHSPTYPSVGAILLGFGCAAARIVACLPSVVKAPLVRYQYRLIADGPTRMHCSEFAFRLYAAAGVAVRLTSPILADIIAHSRAHRHELLELRLERRRATTGVWPDSIPRSVGFAIRGAVTTLFGRLDARIERDHAGLILPADFERSPSFAPVFDVTRRRRAWHVNPVV